MRSEQRQRIREQKAEEKLMNKFNRAERRARTLTDQTKTIPKYQT